MGQGRKMGTDGIPSVAEVSADGEDCPKRKFIDGKWLGKRPISGISCSAGNATKGSHEVAGQQPVAVARSPVQP